jgi:hypothetical protein
MVPKRDRYIKMVCDLYALAPEEIEIVEGRR